MRIDDEAEKALLLRAKAELRKRMRALRNTIPKAALADRSARIVERVRELPEWRAATRIGLFFPIEARNEVDVRPLKALALAEGKAVGYPAIDPATHVMTLRRARADELAERGLGFAEPPEAAEELPAEGLLVVTPALALDADGNRLGYGRGYYDRLLARMAPPAVAVAVAYDFQLLAEVPTTDADTKVALVVTDARVLRRER